MAFDGLGAEVERDLVEAQAEIVFGEELALLLANFDDRSFFLNDEANLHVLDASFARDQRNMFNRDKAHCRRMGEQELRLRIQNLPVELGTRAIKSQL